MKSTKGDSNTFISDTIKALVLYYIVNTYLYICIQGVTDYDVNITCLQYYILLLVYITYMYSHNTYDTTLIMTTVDKQL